MSTSSGLTRRLGWGVPALAATSAMLVVAAPQASAGLVSMGLQAGQGTYVVGNQYTILYRVDADLGTYINNRVIFTDNGKCLGSGFGYSPAAKIPSFDWRPESAGIHTITATMNGKSKSETVNVLAAPADAPPVQPREPGDCSGGGTGSLGS